MLALLSSNPGSVKRCRQISIRFDRPAEQVGEHHSGAGGCLASGDSGIIHGGALDADALEPDLLLKHQPAGSRSGYRDADRGLGLTSRHQSTEVGKDE